MTNAEKYKEVFGFEPEYNNCIANVCNICPLVGKKCFGTGVEDWWNSEYKEMKGSAE